MSCAYNLLPKSKPNVDVTSLHLPIVYESNGIKFQLDIPKSVHEIDQTFAMFMDVIEEGQTYPIESITRQEFEAYFFGHNGFVVRKLDCKLDEDREGPVVGSFYIKPNFPGRSSHLANYGLLVDVQYRGIGIGNFMVENCIKLARQLGYKALYTNLVYATNVASIKACQKYGFVKVGCVPEAGNLKGLGMVDAFQFYKNLYSNNE